MADRVKAEEMLLSEQLWSKLTTGEQICVMRVSWGMSPWVDDSSCINFQYWDSAVAKYMAQELDLEPAGYRDLEPTEVFEPSLLHSENPDLQSKMVSEDPCNKSLEDSFQKLKEALEEWKASSSQLVDEFKKYREEIEATEQVTDSCEESIELLQEDDEQPIGELTHQVISEIVFQESKISQETQKETHQEFKCKNCSTNSEFSGGKNQFSTLEFRFIDGFCFSEDTSSDFVHNGMGELMENRFYPIDIVMNSFGETSMNPLRNSGAYEMFVEMPNRKLNCGSLFLHHNQQLAGQSNRVFDPGEIMIRDSKCYGVIFVPVLLDPIRVLSWNWSCYADIAITAGEPIMVPFDRGKPITQPVSSSSYKPNNFPSKPTFKNSDFLRPKTSNPNPNQNSNSYKSKTSEPQRTHGLRYRCGDKYFAGHRCKLQTLHSLLSTEPENVQNAEFGELNSEIETENVDAAEESEVYVHSLTGSNPLSTIKIQGMVKGKPIVVLVDIGSNHSFLDPRVAKEVQFSMKETNVMMVAVANGNKMFSYQGCRKFEWEMQGHSFCFDMRTLKLGGCDLILGIDWLREFSPLSFDFKEQVSFKVLVFDPGITASLHCCPLFSQSSSLRFLVWWLLENSPWICDANLALLNRTIWMIAWSLRCELWVGFVATEICDCNCKSLVAVLHYSSLESHSDELEWVPSCCCVSWKGNQGLAPTQSLLVWSCFSLLLKITELDNELRCSDSAVPKGVQYIMKSLQWLDLKLVAEHLLN